MSRATVVSSLVAAISALSLSGVSVVEEWEGEERAFNPDAETPAVFVEYAGAGFGDDLEQGAATYDRTYTLQVYVTADGTAEALPLLDALEAALAQLDLDAGGGATVRLWPLSETHEAVILGRHLYRQTYQANALVSR